MLRYSIFAIILSLTWFGLSGYSEYFFLLAGLISIIAVIITTKKMLLLPENIWINYINFRLVTYFFWLLMEIFKSTMEVAIYVWQKNPNISTRFLWVKSLQSDEIGTTIYANSITLTPGTVTVVVDGGEFYVHTLSENSRSGLISNIMANKVANLKGGA